MCWKLASAINIVFLACVAQQFSVCLCTLYLSLWTKPQINNTLQLLQCNKNAAKGICCFSSSNRTKPFQLSTHTMSIFVHSEPTDAPTALRVSKVESTTTTIHWKPVAPNSVQGEFKEYRVGLAVFLKMRTDCWVDLKNTSNSFFSLIYLMSYPPSPSTSQLYYWRESSLVPGLVVSKEKKTKGFFSTVAEPSGILSDLVPFSKYKMFMVVANSRFESPPSNTVEFTTKEGGEDAPRHRPIHILGRKELTSHGVS